MSAAILANSTCLSILRLLTGSVALITSTIAVQSVGVLQRQSRRWQSIIGFHCLIPIALVQFRVTLCHSVMARVVATTKRTIETQWRGSTRAMTRKRLNELREYSLRI